MAAKPFEASKYLTDLNGRDYLEVKWRLLWLRTEHPDAAVETDLVKEEAGLALFRARVTLPAGGTATGWGSETADDFGDYIEKAETKALGRALAALGFGTQFCEDFDFSSEEKGRAKRDRRKVVDAPVASRGLKVIQDGEAGATSSQVNAIYSIARDQALGREAVDERCRAAYGCPPGDLTKRNASKFIDELRALPSKPLRQEVSAAAQ
jgi:hypothetical protein